MKNKKYSKYLPWFELAQKTRDKLNKKGWFTEYQKDDVFIEIIKRINTEDFEASDWEYINDYEKFRVQVKQFEMSFVEQGIEQGIEIGKEQGIEIGKEQGVRLIAKLMKQNGEPVEKIIAYTSLTAQEIENL
ncbi:MAG: hypothetical protein HC892_18185 [Saprospiraceae bacterium]|nr:hypothetical protein [Saprospiraceae bacterium]